VWKVFKTGSVFEDRFFDEDIHACKKAAELIERFNRRNCRLDCAVPMVHLNKPEVWVQQVSKKQGLVEPFIHGRYEKFNSNTGWADASHDLMQALSHYSWHASEGEYLLCDLQGSFRDGC
ncbi:ak1, partial [Symbiodinium pilosum]